MKERIVIEADEKICKGCDTCLQEPRMVAICNLKNNLDIDLKKEQVPETWEELKELCKDLEGKNVFIINAGNCIEFNGLYFWKDGSITFTENNEDIWATKTNVTPDRMYQIIKSLIGEE